MFVRSLIPCTYPFIHQSISLKKQFCSFCIMYPYGICFLIDCPHTFNSSCWMFIADGRKITLDCHTGWTCMVCTNKSKGTSLHIIHLEVCHYRKAFLCAAIGTLP